MSSQSEISEISKEGSEWEREEKKEEADGKVGGGGRAHSHPPSAGPGGCSNHFNGSFLLKGNNAICVAGRQFKNVMF